jgi:hypothetical protein
VLAPVNDARVTARRVLADGVTAAIGQEIPGPGVETGGMLGISPKITSRSRSLFCGNGAERG